MSAWIDISEYATKYGVSQSTLRRRIRSNNITFKMEKGKYLLQDSAETISAAPLYIRLQPRTVTQHAPKNAPPAAAAAYDSVLRENRKLKEQISELETLVKVLEAELAST